MPVGCGDSHPQDTLHGHCMATVTPVMEKTTGAVPLTIAVVGGVNIILAPKRRFKTGKLNAFGFLCVTFGFCDLIDHT